MSLSFKHEWTFLRMMWLFYVPFCFLIVNRKIGFDDVFDDVSYPLTQSVEMTLAAHFPISWND